MARIRQTGANNPPTIKSQGSSAHMVTIALTDGEFVKVYKVDQPDFQGSWRIRHPGGFASGRLVRPQHEKVEFVRGSKVEANAVRAMSVAAPTDDIDKIRVELNSLQQRVELVEKEKLELEKRLRDLELQDTGPDVQNPDGSQFVDDDTYFGSAEQRRSVRADLVHPDTAFVQSLVESIRGSGGKALAERATAADAERAAMLNAAIARSKTAD